MLITGVSTGIGHAATKDLLARGFRIFGSVRNEADAQRTADEFGAKFTPLVFDVTDAAAVRRGEAQVREALGSETLDALINNAGICLYGPLALMDEADFRRQFEINLFGLFDVTRVFLPLLGATNEELARHNGLRPNPARIINLSSLSGRIAYPMLGGYAATKFAVEALSDSLRRELMLFGIDVIIIEPGSIRTPIWDKGLSLDMTSYRGSAYEELIARTHHDLEGQRDDALPVERVTAAIHTALTKRRPKTRYVVPNSPLTRWWLPHLIPDRWLDFAIFKALDYRSARANVARRFKSFPGA